MRSALLLAFLFITNLVVAEPMRLFNGKDLSGWKGAADLWSVKDGAIYGTTKGKKLDGNTFLIWQGGNVADFELTAKVRFAGNNSGIQYRSTVLDADSFVVKGYQCDLHPSQKFFGMLYAEKWRGIVCQRGQKVTVGSDGKPKVVGSVGDDTEFDNTQWNDVRIIAVGNRLIHQVNGITTADITDNHPEAAKQGIVALQLHRGPEMTVEVKDIALTHLKGAAGKAVLATVATVKAPRKKTQQAAKWPMTEPKPKWIWAKGNAQEVWFRKSFQINKAVKSARLFTTCDNRMTLFINGKRAGTSRDWMFPIREDVRGSLKVGRNLIAVSGRNAGGIAAFVFKLQITTADGAVHHVLSDGTWKFATEPHRGFQGPQFDDSKWSSDLKLAGALGVQPWGNPGSSVADYQPVPLTVLPGFKAEKLYTVPKEEQGSWVSLTVDHDGGLIASDQQDKGLYKITVNDTSAEPQVSVKKMPVTFSGAQGMLRAFGGLYANKNGGHLHFLTDTDNDGLYDTAQPLPSSTGGGEHGNHAVIHTEDRSKLYIAGGNHTELPPELASSRVTTWGEDLLLPRDWDARGHARGRMAPGGWVSIFDPKAKNYELYCVGYRNQFDIALNRFGDMFTFDADMEWDMGMPWYRPTRICLVASGADYGWRSGTGKWPTYYEDSLPPVVDIGPGSPTGVVAGLGAKFPAKYQDAIYALDWTFGTIYAIHLEPKGAGYVGASEPFAYGSPLPVTDAIIGHDGHLYFAVGGRGAQSELYRIRYVGNEPTNSIVDKIRPENPERKARRMLETFHGKTDPNAVATAWPYLSSNDRFLRHAARIAIESQPANEWADRLFAADDPQTRITGAVALARKDEPSYREPLVNSLLDLDPVMLTDSQFLGLLRAYALSFIRLGKPTEAEREKIISALDKHLPNKNPDLNTELIRVLVYLRAPGIIGKTIALIDNRSKPQLPDWADVIKRNARYGSTIGAMLKNHPPSREIGYALMLRNIRKGWTLGQRRTYFAFLNEAAKAVGGASFPGFLTNIREEALGNCTNEERAALKDITGEDFNPKPTFEIKPPEGPGQKWTVEEALKFANRGQLTKANFERGRSLFFATNCGKCHRFAGLGGDIGPDVTSVRNKFDINYVIEAIIKPNKVISDQYAAKKVLLASGEIAAGLVATEADKLVIYPSDPNAKPIVVARNDVEEIAPSTTSQMPEGLLDPLSPEELRDLVAYIMSGGNPNDRVYGQRRR